MDVEEFDYNLPKEFIAQTPLEKRSNSKLLVMNRNNGEISHKHFYDIVDYLQKGDHLVLNNTKVMPSRIYGEKIETHAHIEFLLLKATAKDTYESLCRPARRVAVGTEIDFSGIMKGVVVSKEDEGICHIKFIYEGIFIEKLSKLGEVPLPPYIHEKLNNPDRYQTVYAEEWGSAAAPTAGLHFTPEILTKIRNKGIIIDEVTLHVGLGTFRPMTTNKVEDHHMHSEWYHMTADVAKDLNDAKSKGERIVAVGTTVTRTLESIMKNYGKFTEVAENTNIFIFPGFKFKAIDALITNFHLPKSTLVMLVSAFSTKESIMHAYEEAKKNNYRFFSFGDAMFIH
ncbi:MAG: tRNA preQ1(34) S-adenosylmethionine ribosyltransferase-isomerase QueA [Bacilli bacterium]